MNINYLIPMIIIGAILQISVQIVCIKDCLKNTEFTSKKRMILLFIITFLAIPGVIIYLIIIRKKSLDYSVVGTDVDIDNNMKQSIFLSLFFAYEILLVNIISQNPGNRLIAILLSCVLVILIFQHYYASKKHKKLYSVIPFVLVLLVIGVNYISKTSDYKFIILIVVASIVNDYPLKYSKAFVWIPLVLYEGVAAIKLLNASSNITSDELIGYLAKDFIVYILVVYTFYIAKKHLILNSHLRVLMKELKSKTQKLEKIRVLEERNRIAREIHDALGHTLTGAIIQLEAAKKLVYVDQKKAVESIELTQNITRAGFSDVKRAIKALRPIMIEDSSLKDTLELLFERTRKDFECTVDYNIELPNNISDDIKVCVYRIFQELITNSIRHGDATVIQASIECQYNVLRINMNNNGKGCKVINEGYGLTGIRERVELLGGQVYFSSNEDSGFNSVIYIPLEKNDQVKT